MQPFIPRNQLPAAARRQMEAQAYEIPFPYFSTVKLVARTNAAGNAYELARGTVVTAFSYGRGQSKDPAGFTAEDGVATEADTNLTNAGQTISGEQVNIRGMACQVLPRSLDVAPAGSPPAVIAPADANFLGALCESLSVELSLNGGRETFQLGTLGMVPGAGGIYGGGQPSSVPPGLAQNQPISELFPSNGMPMANNNFRVPNGITWKNQGQRDSQLSIIFRNTRAISIPKPADRDAGTGITAWTAPPILAVTIKTFLDGLVVSPRSDVV